MSNINALKKAVEQLEVLSNELRDAENELSNWQDHDLTRRDGSGRQDATNDRIGREANDRVWLAKKNVESQKKLITDLTTAV